jgi:sterol desaturase/sphingolipid hydroxylase (fatty acid hydroxylase superfamily)
MPLKEQWMLLFGTPIYILVILGEIVLSNIQLKKFYSVKETLLNVYLSILNGGIDILFRVIYFGVLFWFYEHRIIETWNSALLYWIAIFIAEDFMYYWEHRFDHQIRLFWAVHVTHHSSEEFNLTTGFRSSVFQPLYRFIYFIPLAVLGFKPLDIIFVYSSTQIYGILVHTQFIIKMPAWFEAVFVSPSHHRVHHASNVKYLDRNMGMVLIIWDKLFGTFEKENDSEKIVYGLTKPLEEKHHPVKIVTHEWQAIRNDLKKPVPIIVKLKYLFMPPGWSHDGSTKTSDQLRADLNNE